LEQHVRHVGDQAARSIASGQNRVELGQQPRPQVRFVSLCLLPEPFRFLRGLARLLGLYSKLTLLGLGCAARSICLLLGFLGSFLLVGRFQRRSLRLRSHALGLNFGSFRLGPRGFSISATLSFGVRQCLRLGLSGRSRGSSLFFCSLLHSHH